jgi:hypothetical protein
MPTWRHGFLVAWFVALAWGAAAPRAAAGADPPMVRIPRVDKPPTLAEFLDGTEPAGWLRITDFVQREPGDGVPVSQPTTAYLGYDAQHLYVVFVCRDDPAQVRAHLAKREAIMGDDIVGVVLDTFRDRRRAYLFLTNPLGIQLDGVVTEGQDDDYTFDALWESDGRLTPDGYVVRIAIPFRSLRFSEAPEQRWGIALGRIIVRNNETSFWPYVTRRIPSFAQQMATLEGLEHVSPGRNLQAIPYSTLTAARVLETDPAAYARTTSGRAGLDAKLVLRDAVTVDLTLNPDFSQVESDEPQVTINQRFEVFFPEKRPFFIENAGFFQTPQTLFFSRRVADPQFGARVTGKTGRWAFGGLAIDDRRSALARATVARDPAGRAGVVVARVQRELGAQSAVGALVTNQQVGGTANRVASADVRLKLSEHWYFTAQATLSRVTAGDGATAEGTAYDARLRYGSRRFTYAAEYVDRSPRFATSLGFIPRVDMRQAEQYVRYRWFPERRGLVSLGPSLFLLANWDHRGVLQDRQGFLQFGAELKGQTSVEVERTEAMERYQGVAFSRRTTRIAGDTQRWRWLGVTGSYVSGTEINYYPAPPLSPFLAHAARARAGVTLRPSTRLRLEHTSLYTRLAAPAGLAASLGTHPAVFRNHIVRSRVDYQATRELSFRAIVDYETVRPNPALVALERRERVRADVLVTYLVNPWTALYIGYTDAFENLAFDRDLAALRRTAHPTLSTGRQVFVKVSYLARW